MKDKKICILGKLQSKYMAPFDDQSWTIWSMNKHIDEALIPRVDVWFDLHENTESKFYNHNADIKSKDFPFEECHQLVGGRYFNNTVSYLIAYAIILGATDISLYGMRFIADHEHRRDELFNVRNMIFFAKGRGVNVHIYKEDKLFLLPENLRQEGKEFDQ